MRRFTWMAVVLGAGLLVGCQNMDDAVGMGPEDGAQPFPESTVIRYQEDVGSPAPREVSPPVDTTPKASSGSSPQPKENYGTGGSAKTYVVKRGDTLYSIARSQYDGDSSAWRRVFEANREALQNDPNKLEVGMTLVIP